MTTIRWTNPSVKLLAGESDPSSVIVEKAQELLLKAMDEGWRGPPFDPFLLAEHLGLSLVPREDILDARLISRVGKSEIEYNPNKPETRMRFSIAHEIAHTIFPDFEKSPHNRARTTTRDDAWQVELLCNIAAAEILMPVGPSLDVDDVPITIDRIVVLRKTYRVSTEAVLLRVAKLTTQSITVFAAAREKDDPTAPYRIDYVVNSSTSKLDLNPGTRIPPDSVLSECSATGFTAKRREKWSADSPLFEVECIGVLPYFDSAYPRVLGIIKTQRKPGPQPLAICYLIGNALEPRGKGQKVIAHIVNNESENWGRGFGLAISKKWPVVRKSWHDHVRENRVNLRLGRTHLLRVEDDLSIFSMVAQRGYGQSDLPRISYRSLRDCLRTLSKASTELSATVHMPRIGTGYAGGSWMIVSKLIEDALTSQGIEVTVYDLPGEEKIVEKQAALDFAFASASV